MPVKIRLPGIVRRFVDDQVEIEVQAGNVGEALDLLGSEYPDLRKRLHDESGKLRDFVNLFLNGVNIRAIRGLATPIPAGSTITLLPADSPPVLESYPGEELGAEDLKKYSRHIILPEIGREGQKKLKNSRVILIGAGGLGSSAALYLAAAGVGTLGLADFDQVDASNLQRQVLHGVRDVGRPKTASARDRLKALNESIRLETFDVLLNRSNILDIIGDFEVVIDATDNFPTRYLINDACVLSGKPDIFGSIYRFEGQASVFAAKGGACYRCLFAEPPPPGLVPSCGESGVLGVLPGIIGCVQAAETIKLLLGGGDPLIGRLLLLDAWKMKFRELNIRRDPACPICGENPVIRELVDYEEFCGFKKGMEADPIEQIDAPELKKMLETEPNPQIIDIREAHELALGTLPNSKSIPFGQLARRREELDPGKAAVFVCKIGIRSEMAIRQLKKAGYPGKMINLRGGMNSWAREVDPNCIAY
ncbi:MAG: molybdopterin-synthase adenylyltransferase MoeB [Planctomycetota bacterium]|jgi:adenylyltransferase/sulfurtransferase|nr:molybdopterin-synthase adenylyltransferase MoeB [Planctomycetota bacterium]